jgi:hypothetical protein
MFATSRPHTYTYLFSHLTVPPALPSPNTSYSAPVSRLEVLPSETFNRVLDYIFSPADCKVPENPTTFGIHRFHTAILRVNKAIHRLAKSHLYHNLTWIRFDINWGSFLIDPHWLGIPYIAIDRKDTQFEISYPYASHVERRSPNQQAPEGNISVHIKFPPPATDTQKDIWNNCVQSPDSSMSLLVPAEDFDPFMDVLRMNDLAYCCRRWRDLLKDGGSGKGVSFDIDVRPGQEKKGYKRLLDRFQDFHGTSSPSPATMILCTQLWSQKRLNCASATIAANARSSTPRRKHTSQPSGTSCT